MTDPTPLSPAADAVLDAYMNNCGWLDGPLERDYRCAAAALRAAVAHTQVHHGNDVWECDADELLAIAAELEGK